MPATPPGSWHGPSGSCAACRPFVVRSGARGDRHKGIVAHEDLSFFATKCAKNHSSSLSAPARMAPRPRRPREQQAEDLRLRSRHARLLGALFESLLTLSVRVYAQATRARSATSERATATTRWI